ncbi:hypothetical protein [Flavobacterium aquidurense]|uniref:Lipoprotein n=1 Tax=Flavobacterium aquidurense TaxID=362413 RepID=A0A0Q0RQ04_9FLAO|nr:hypothetical protein [Flavobacterium aquidurense]KQB38464.1 hypothetical protein RC62_1819 [Flavobacterium aquidurense]
MKTFMKVTTVIFFLLLISLFFGCSNFEDNLHEVVNVDKGTPGTTIERSSELYKTLQKATTSKVLQGEIIPCVEFVYPLSLRIYDNNLNTIGSTNLFSDSQFSKILENLPNGQSLNRTIIKHK